MAKGIEAHVPHTKDLVLIGIRTRGVPLASRISSMIHGNNGLVIPVGVLDITLYRDDLSRLAYQPMVKKTEIRGSIDSKTVFIVDDVLYTGRTIRCALDALFDFGRPDRIGLATLVDRGGRELPIQADVIGVRYASKGDENVRVKVAETDGEDAVVIEKAK